MLETCSQAQLQSPYNITFTKVTVQLSKRSYFTDLLGLVIVQVGLS